MLIDLSLHVKIPLLVISSLTLMTCYYDLYEKSPKKCRELSDIIDYLKEVYKLPQGGNLLVRASGSRWITHKRKVLQCVVDHYGAYLDHTAILVEDLPRRLNASHFGSTL